MSRCSRNEQRLESSSSELTEFSLRLKLTAAELSVLLESSSNVVELRHFIHEHEHLSLKIGYEVYNTYVSLRDSNSKGFSERLQ